jgi:type IV secretion system protein VirB9
MKRHWLAFSLAVVLASPAHAALVPKPGPGDPRIRVVRYDPEEVVALTGVIGFQFSIEFEEGERIENVSIGDALGWQVTPNSKASLLFLKPVAHSSTTNMTVVTSARRYVFSLNVSPQSGREAERKAMFALHFAYPPPPPEPPTPPVVVKIAPVVANAGYTYEGSIKSLPSRVFDDGTETYFQFGELEDYPAIFAIDADGGEAVVNFVVRDGYLVVDQVARGFVLRSGSEITKLYNDGFQEKVPGPLSPRARAKPKSNLPWVRK